MNLLRWYNNFDYDFKGDSLFYPYELPKEILKFRLPNIGIGWSKWKW